MIQIIEMCGRRQALLLYGYIIPIDEITKVNLESMRCDEWCGCNAKDHFWVDCDNCTKKYLVQISTDERCYLAKTKEDSRILRELLLGNCWGPLYERERNNEKHME